MDVKDIKKIVELVSANELAEFELEQDDVRLFIKKTADAPAVMFPGGPAPMPMMPAPVATAPAAAPAAPAAAPTADEDAGLENITSPIVGTFYAAPAPDAPAFVKVGDQVTEETVVCIVEAMKVMNEIKAEARGTIRKIMVDNATPVEFGQVLFKIEP